METTRESWLRTVGAFLLLVAAALLVWRVRDVLLVVLLALVCAYVLRPLVGGLNRLGFRRRGRLLPLSRGLATGLVFLLLAFVVWGIWRLSAPSLARQVDQLHAGWPRYRDALLQAYSDAARYYREQLPPAMRPAVDSWVGGAARLLTSTATKGLNFTVKSVAFLVELFLVPILTFYFLADGPAIRRQALFFVPRRYLHRTERALDQTDDILQRYIKGQVILCLIAFLVVTLGLWALGVDFYLLLGLIAGLTRAVPVIGPIVGAVPILILVGATQSFGLALWILLFFTLMHILESKLLMPAILGRQLNLHPALIIVALLIGAETGGLLGVFLAAPVLAAIKTLIEQQRMGFAERA